MSRSVKPSTGPAKNNHWPDAPVRVAGIDVGSNGIRMLVAEDDGHGGFTPVAAERAAVRLGHLAFTQGRLDPAQVASAMEALSRFGDIIAAERVTQVRAVATSAVRDARDGRRFVERVRKDTGIALEIIAGSEESRLVHRAVSARIPLDPGPWIVADLGGGSLEIALADKDRIHWSESRQVGTVRLLEQHAGAPPEAMAERIEEHMRPFRLLHSSEGLSLGGLVLCGGNGNELSAMAGTGTRDHSATLSREALRCLVGELSGLSVSQRMGRWGLRPDRADVILPAALVYLRIAELIGIDTLHVPGWGLREGIVLDLLDERLRPAERDRRMDLDVREASLSLGRALGFDETHALHVTGTALQIYDDLQKVHRMGARNRLVLHAAALLHDVGRVLSERGYHKHSMYLIQNAEIPGMGRHDLDLAACVARYHRGVLPKAMHPVYGGLNEKDRRRVDRLAGMLRLADGLCSSRRYRFHEVRAEASPEAIHIRLSSEEFMRREVREALPKADLLRRAFGRDVNVERVAPTTPGAPKHPRRDAQ